VKAIETKYAGCLFRSRLEARWAVFFETLGLRWEHEPEGFKTSAGWYLPDFRVWYPGLAYPQYFEVKPAWSLIKPDELAKIMAFGRNVRGGLIVLDGQPEMRAYLATDILDDKDWMSNQKPTDYKRAGYFMLGCKGYPFFDWHDNIVGDNDPSEEIMQPAIVAAKSARFK
jgi:hypothetical protein